VQVKTLSPLVCSCTATVGVLYQWFRMLVVGEEHQPLDLDEGKFLNFTNQSISGGEL
jgi:hypothetical protein